MADSYPQRLVSDFQQDFGAGLYLVSGSGETTSDSASMKDRSLRSRNDGALKKRNIIRWVSALMIVVSVALAGVLLYMTVIAPRIQVSRVEITGLYGVTQDEVMAATEIRSGMLITDINTSEIVNRVEALPRVLNARVEKRFPDTLSIEIEVRRPLGMVFHQGAIQGIDTSGVIFPIEQAEQAELPILTGFQIGKSGKGPQGLDPRYLPFIADLEKLRLEDPALFRMFSEFEFQNIAPGGYQVLIYPSHTQIRVLVGDRFPRERAVYVLRMIQMVDDPGYPEPVGEIDFRTDDMVYTRIGGQS
ncbi:cell division protein FtsQ/DivIB [Spirochaeta lutea]|uniref:POTRA domain-containing protein n=1 Tax=Spirochaeta lutea TaxID=1480694 RepID=A0A098R158_9SPIO|nr:FtsQ-type POTRA domain-containing protein [Spirochaeta lutea]KGE73511.1 hypothetical protein DC28_02260 [Spirochaeta lutea]